MIAGTARRITDYSAPVPTASAAPTLATSTAGLMPSIAPPSAPPPDTAKPQVNNYKFFLLMGAAAIMAIALAYLIYKTLA